MIFTDKENLYMEKGDMEKMLKVLNLGESGMYLTIKSFQVDSQEGVNEMKILESSSDGVEENRKILESLIKKSFVERTKNGIMATTRELQ